MKLHLFTNYYFKTKQWLVEYISALFIVEFIINAFWNVCFLCLFHVLFIPNHASLVINKKSKKHYHLILTFSSNKKSPHISCIRKSGNKSLYLEGERALANNYFLRNAVSLRHTRANSTRSSNEGSKAMILKSQQHFKVKICIIIISVRQSTQLD